MDCGARRVMPVHRVEEGLALAHWDTWAQSWNVERRHLQTQINRDLAKAKAKTAKAAAEAKRRRDKLASNWKGEDEVYVSFIKSQGQISTQDKAIRTADDVTDVVTSKLKHEAKTNLTVETRQYLETRQSSAEKMSTRHGQEHWKHLMQRGAKEYDLEQQEKANARARAVRGHRWLKEDEEHDAKTDATGGTTRLSATRLATTRLPTSPTKSGHHQTPGKWRTSQQTMMPGTGHPLHHPPLLLIANAASRSLSPSLAPAHAHDALSRACACGGQARGRMTCSRTRLCAPRRPRGGRTTSGLKHTTGRRVCARRASTHGART